MKKILLAILALPMSLFAELPEASQGLIDKLSAWEVERKIDLQEEIKAKRAEVVRLLQAQLRASTKSGDLDAALEIKKEIERLSEAGVAPARPENNTDPRRSKNDDELADFVRGAVGNFPMEGC